MLEILHGTPFCENDTLIQKMKNDIAKKVVAKFKSSQQDAKTDEKNIDNVLVTRLEMKSTKPFQRNLDLLLTDIVMCWNGQVVIMVVTMIMIVVMMKINKMRAIKKQTKMKKR